MKNVLVAGAKGMVGAAVCRKLEEHDLRYTGITREDGDLTNRSDLERIFASGKFDTVIVAAAKVGGINANNTYPAEFIYENLLIECNLIDTAFRSDIERLIFLGSSCIYPKFAPQPISEADLLTGHLEPTNEPYAIAKIAGIKMCESYNRQYGCDYRSLMPTNLYGPGDNFHAENSHVIPALMARFHQAKLQNSRQVTVWGSGNPMREFLHVDDLASAVVHVLRVDKERYGRFVDERCSHLNVGTGQDVTIRELAELTRAVVGLEATLEFDPSKPDGTMRKLLNIDKISGLGWRPEISLADGLRETYTWFLAHTNQIRQ